MARTSSRTKEPLIPTAAIGLAAGGIKALQGFFDAISNDLGIAYVLVCNIEPDDPKAVVDALSDHTGMPVTVVQAQTVIKADQIYVLPSNSNLIATEATLEGQPETAARGAPVDRFFRAMGEHHGDGFAIVLSGASSDGAVGLKAIKEGGGVILVQDPAEADFGSMPRSAIASGLADVVLPVRELAARLTELAHAKQRAREVGAEDSEASLGTVLAYLRTRTGHDFSHYKRSTVLRRLTRRMQLTRVDDLKAYLAFVRDNVGELTALFSDLLISVTTFFRDRQAYEALERLVIPAISGDVETPVRVWVPGCATGEEAYSIAMLLLEATAERGQRPEITIFATDLDLGVLATAREGRYSAAIEADVSSERLQRFFTRDGDHYRIKKEVRDLVVFAHHSLLKDPPFSRMDFISCRNLLIYLERDLQSQVCIAFHYALKPARYLFLGSAETADSTSGLFRALDRECRIYQAIDQVGTSALPRLLLTQHPPVVSPIRLQPRSSTQVDATMHMGALEEYAPPSAIVDEDSRILHLSERAGKFIQPSAGPLGTTLTQLALPELRLDIRTGLRRALEKGETVLSTPIAVMVEGALRRILIQTSRVDRADDPRPMALVLFIDGGAATDGDRLEIEASATQDDAMQLHQDLQLTRERLKASREEYEAANEELRAANEELQSINEEYRSTSEELETSKEELQSMNEELQTLNVELKTKLDGVSRAHSDLQNLVAATDVGTLFLDPQLRIKRFTPRLAELFNIKPGDEGRSITDFTHRLSYQDLASDARRVIGDLATQEREARSSNGEWFLIRLRPYRTIDDKIDGVVVTFVDVTERKAVEIRSQQLSNELDHRVKNILSRVSVVLDRSERAGQTAGELANVLKLRVNSMADTHALLSQARWAGVSLHQLASAELGLYLQNGNVEISGDDVVLSPEATQSFSSVVHELTTNALKYGALSRENGKVSFKTRVAKSPTGTRLHVVWRESDGPPVRKPEHRGFGLSVIDEVLRYEFQADIKVEFETSGVVVSIDVPEARVVPRIIRT